MGADFPGKAQKTFQKSWDSAKVSLGTADLFTQQPRCGETTIAVEISPAAILIVGEKLIVEAVSGELVVKRGLLEIGRCGTSTPQIRDGLAKSAGVACGTVQLIHVLASVAEVSLC